jgi:hypothetical protein
LYQKPHFFSNFKIFGSNKALFIKIFTPQSAQKKRHPSGARAENICRVTQIICKGKSAARNLKAPAPALGARRHPARKRPGKGYWKPKSYDNAAPINYISGASISLNHPVCEPGLFRIAVRQVIVRDVNIC